VRVLAALSGGVDSSVAAARATAAGHDVVGIHLALSKTPESYRNGARGCCTLEDSRDARRTADILGIPFYVWDLSDQFHAEVIDDFVGEYEAGRTPNPCIRCNERIKFSAVLERGLSLGFDAVCTGHYARIVEGVAGRELHRAVDESKDQSYVLGGLSQTQLEHSLFPLGESVKSDVRREAATRGLLVADKPDSYDLCFVTDGDTQGYLRARLGRRAGRIVDVDGVDLGGHDGAYAYTVGQRKGLGIGGGEPLFVFRIDAASNRVVVGPRVALRVTHVEAGDAVWRGQAQERVSAMVRYRMAPIDAAAAFDSGRLKMAFSEALEGVAPGQAIVCYRDDLVVGGGVIECAS
jgi:tRNA-specific 2-thiouridylase